MLGLGLGLMLVLGLGAYAQVDDIPYRIHTFQVHHIGYIDPVTSPTTNPDPILPITLKKTRA
jgi:hypothetical protein